MKIKDVKKIITRNPRVDTEQLKDVRRLLKLLRKHGIKPKEYDIVSPFSPRNLQRSTDDVEERNKED